MYKILAVASRQLCAEDFLQRLEKIAAAKISGLILREKDLPDTAYEDLARQVLPLCRRYDIPCILHGRQDVARRLWWPHIHLPLPLLRQGFADHGYWETLGVSVHSLEEAKAAAALGATYLTAGHIFPTACKENLPPRGTGWLGQICRHLRIPVYALGGITPQTAGELSGLPIAGVAVMSGLMACSDPESYIDALRTAGENGFPG